jgi:hypothetical protein
LRSALLIEYHCNVLFVAYSGVTGIHQNVSIGEDRIVAHIVCSTRMSQPHEISSVVFRKRVLSTSALWRCLAVVVTAAVAMIAVDQIPTVQGQRSIVNLGKRLLGHRRRSTSQKKQPPLGSSGSNGYVLLEGENKWWWSSLMSSSSSFYAKQSENNATLVWIVTLVALVCGGGAYIALTKRRRRRLGDYSLLDMHTSSTKEGECVCVRMRIRVRVCPSFW